MFACNPATPLVPLDLRNFKSARRRVTVVTTVPIIATSCEDVRNEIHPNSSAAGGADGQQCSRPTCEADCKNKPNASQDAAVTAIEELGGHVTIDTKSPNRPVTAVNLFRTQVTDPGLVHLKGMTKLDLLILSDTQVTAAGLMHLKGLTNLERLNLYGTKVTAAAVNKLQQALPNCKISR